MCPWHPNLDTNSPPTQLILNGYTAPYQISKALGSKGANVKARVVSSDPNPKRQLEPCTLVTDMRNHWMALWVHANVYGRTFVFLLKRLCKKKKKGCVALTGNLAHFELKCAKWFGKYLLLKIGTPAVLVVRQGRRVALPLSPCCC